MLKIGTPLTERRYLSDVLDEVRRLEGECPDEERAWVECRQLTEGEERKVDAFRGAIQTRYETDTPVFTRPVNWSLIRRELCKYAIAGVGNVQDGKGKSLFIKMRDGSWDGGDAAFMEKWDVLLPAVALAMARVAVMVNPQYDIPEIIGPTLHPDPMILLRIYHPDVYDDMVERVEKGAEKNLVSGEPSESES